MYHFRSQAINWFLSNRRCRCRWLSLRRNRISLANFQQILMTMLISSTIYLIFFLVEIWNRCASELVRLQSDATGTRTRTHTQPAAAYPRLLVTLFSATSPNSFCLFVVNHCQLRLILVNGLQMQIESLHELRRMQNESFRFSGWSHYKKSLCGTLFDFT